MKLWTSISVADDERVLLYRDRQLVRVLHSGRYRMFDPGRRYSTETLSLREAGVKHGNLEVLLTLEIFRAEVDVETIGQEEVGIVRLDGQVKAVLEPGSRFVRWRSSENLTLECIDISNNYRIAPALLAQLERSGVNGIGSHKAWMQLTVPDQTLGQLFVDGRLAETLPSGRYGFWLYNRELNTQVSDLKWQSVEISGQEILTRDRVSLRLNLNAVYRFSDVVKLLSQVKSPGDYIYRRLQLALRETVGTRTLDELLADKNAIAKTITKSVSEHLQEMGFELEQIGIKDIILPGDMKDILNQVVQAQKTAEANLIRRREETAATRSLQNTARMIEGNPVLLRLKELEALEKVADRIGHLTVYGGLEGVMNGLVSLTGAVKSSNGQTTS